jgi:acetoin utilization deacetylase AcuC-like enzyme
MRVILNPRHEQHVPPGEVENGVVIPCYECPPRLTAIRTAIEADFAGKHTFEEPGIFGEEVLATLHDSAYIAYLRETSAEIRRARGSTPKVQWPTVFPYGPNPRATGNRALRGQYCFDTYTPILGGTFSAALGGVSASLRGAELLASGAEQVVYVLTRPPGHHAERDRCGGYCYFNNAGLAAQRLSALGKVAVLDLDVHHGNGTQHIFEQRDDVFTLSIHGDPAGLYPFFSGYSDEIGTGPGLGFNLNITLPPGTGPKEYRPALAAVLDRIGSFRPTFLVLPFGADSHDADPIGGFKLPTAFFREMGAAVRALGLPTLVTQEGGYNLDVIGACVVEFLRGLAGEC